MPLETICLGALTAPAFYLFTFFMITDPATSPPAAADQVLVAAAIVLVDLALHFNESLNTLFDAAFAVGAARWRRGCTGARALAGGYGLRARLAAWWRRVAVVGALGVRSRRSACPPGSVTGSSRGATAPPGFALRAPRRVAYRDARAPGEALLDEVDPAIAHIAKWLLSVGDAVAAADVDGDGLQDIFLTHPLKDADEPGGACTATAATSGSNASRSRRWTRRTRDPRVNGLPSGALFFDYDNDGDQDLVVLIGFGRRSCSSRTASSRTAGSASTT